MAFSIFHGPPPPLPTRWFPYCCCCTVPWLVSLQMPSLIAATLKGAGDNQARRRHRRTICVRALPPPPLQSQEPHIAGFPSMPVAHAHYFDGLLKE